MLTSSAEVAQTQQDVFDAVLLSSDHQVLLLDALGLHGVHLACICKSWSEAVAERRIVWEVLRPGLSFGGSGDAPGRLQNPSGVAALTQGAVCVADMGNNRLQILSRQPGVAPRVIGSWGRGPGQFQLPLGVAYDGEALFVADSGNHRIQKLRLADGAPLGSIGTESGTFRIRGGEGRFNNPEAVCVAAGTVYVSDHSNSRIVALTTDLTWRYAFGQWGTGDAEFNGPSGVVVHGDELFVADIYNNRIQAPATQPYTLVAYASPAARYAVPCHRFSRWATTGGCTSGAPLVVWATRPGFFGSRMTWRSRAGCW